MNLIEEYFFKVFNTSRGCHRNGAISLLVQLFSSGITQFLNSEMLSFHLMYDAFYSNEKVPKIQCIWPFLHIYPKRGVTQYKHLFNISPY